MLGPEETKLSPGNLLIEFDKFWLLIGLYLSKFNLFTLYTIINGTTSFNIKYYPMAIGISI
jgi:hypothetical protein